MSDTGSSWLSLLGQYFRDSVPVYQYLALVVHANDTCFNLCCSTLLCERACTVIIIIVGLFVISSISSQRSARIGRVQAENRMQLNQTDAQPSFPKTFD
jgi:hypothetical protein